MKIKTLNNPRGVQPLSDNIQWRYPWLKHGMRVRWHYDGSEDEIVDNIWKIWDPNDELYSNIAEDMEAIMYNHRLAWRGDHMTEAEALNEITDRIIYLVHDRGSEAEVFLHELLPVGEPQQGTEWQYECQHCGFRSQNQNEREVWDSVSEGINEGKCFSCQLHDPETINVTCARAYNYTESLSYCCVNTSNTYR